MSTQYPALNPAILLTPAEDSYVAYDPTSDRLHTLNPVAALIAELCDGTRNIEQIRALVSPLLPDGQSAEVDRLVQQGVEAGLFVIHADSGAVHRELTARELHDLAHRLQNGGKLQTALICERRVTEMAPDNPAGWYHLGELAEMLGRREETRAAYEKYLELKPDSEEIRHILVALRDEAPPPRMPDKCVVQIYDGFASTFEERLLQDLGYKGPQRVHELIAPLLAARPDQTPLPTPSNAPADGGEGSAFSSTQPRSTLQVLDLGCGTGLAGAEFKPYAARLVGIDISAEMVALARNRNIYDHLEVAEVTAWLAAARAANQRFDLALCCDCLIYFGDLQEVASGVSAVLNPGGLFALTTERSERFPFHLNDAGRYEHHPDYIREVAAVAGLEVTRLDSGFLRTEYSKDVTGLFVALTQPSR